MVIDTYLPQQDQQFLQSLAVQARQELLEIHAEMILFAVNNENDSHVELLRQPVMVPDAKDPWNYFGWLYAMEWATGGREVVYLEGDNGNLTLLSTRLLDEFNTITPTELPTSVSSSTLRVVEYTGLIFILCAGLVLIYAIGNKGRIAGANLLEFNRVAGAVWIGRPLLIARGIIAICMLSTSDLVLHQHGSMVKLEESRKPWYNVVIAAGESCWLSYVLTELVVTFSHGYTFRYAAFAAIVVQAINAMIGLIRPFEHNAEINLQCEMTTFYGDVVCHSGSVVVGSLSRLVLLSLVTVAITLLALVGSRLVLTPFKTTGGGALLLSAIAKEVYHRDGWMHEGRWYLDQASAMLTGLVTFKFRGCWRVLDVKSWTLLCLKNNQLSSVASAVHDGQRGDNDDTSGVPDKLKNAIALTVAFDDDE